MFMDDTIEFCKETGYVRTMKNRIRYIPDIHSNIYMQREFAKRMAMNAPIQGSAADIIKIAMILLDKKLEENRLSSKLLLTIHDELVLEVTKGEEEIVEKERDFCVAGTEFGNEQELTMNEGVSAVTTTYATGAERLREISDETDREDIAEICEILADIFDRRHMEIMARLNR
jgi:hypothetical protein